MHYEKRITLPNNSLSVATQAKSSTDIPEQLVLEGTEFKLFWNTNGDQLNMLNDSRFAVNFVDTNQNNIVDKIEWIMPVSSGDVTIEADHPIPASDLKSKMKTMEEKIDTKFHKKTLAMMNAKAAGKLEEYLSLERTKDSKINLLADTKSEYYEVIILVPKIIGTDIDPLLTTKLNKDKLVSTLLTLHRAKDVFKADLLPFVTAKIPAEEIPKLADHDFVYSMGDGEMPVKTELDMSKQVINAQNLIFNGNGVNVSVIDSGIRQNHVDLPIGTKITKQVFCNEADCINEGQNQPDAENHGTHVADIIAGLGIENSSLSGIAPGATLLNVRTDESFSSAGLARSLEWSLQNGARVINLSLFIGDPNTVCSSATVNAIVDEVVDEGVVVVKSAGNNRIPANSPTITDPGCGFNVLTVGNMDDRNTVSILDESF